MRTRDQTLRQDVVARRLALLHAELARDWRQAGDLPELADEPLAPAGLDGGAWVDEESDPRLDPASSRRSALRDTVRELLPDSLRGRVSLESWQATVVALVVAVGLLLTCWHVVRSSASVDTMAGAGPSGSPLLPAGAPSPVSAVSYSSHPSTPSGSASRVVIDVEGAVRRPGVKRLPEGARVLDALHAAGGVTKRSRLNGLNLAAMLTDGEQIRVGVPGGGLSDAAPTGDGALGPDVKIDLNTADAGQLDALPGVGPVTAQSILQWRQKNGRFTSVKELMEVSGIGPATLAKIAPHATV